MPQIPPIEDSFIDGVIRSAGPYNSNNKKTQGAKLRELVKLLRDRMEEQIAGAKTSSQSEISTKANAGDVVYKTTQVNGKALSSDISLTTSDVVEGSNLYYSDSRVDSRIEAQKGTANGLAPLDEAGKLSTSYLPESILGSVTYKGTYNPSTNTPILPSASTSKGWYYIIAANGSHSEVDFRMGDWIISDGTYWQKVDNNNNVTSVAGKVGAVSLVKNDVGLANVDNTSDTDKPVSTATQAALNLKATDANVVHRSGAESISGDKKFLNNLTFGSSGYFTSDSTRMYLRAFNGKSLQIGVEGETQNDSISIGSNGIPVFNKAFDTNSVSAVFTAPVSGVDAVSAQQYVTYQQITNKFKPLAYVPDWAEIINKPNLALIDNLAAGQTIGANTTGNAASATSWGARQADLGSAVNYLDQFLVTDGLDNKVRLGSATQVKTALGINDGSTLANNISGTAANSNRWNGQEYDTSELWSGNGLGLYYDTNVGKFRIAELATIKTALATSLQDVTSAGNTTNNKLILTKDADQIRLQSPGANYTDILSGTAGFGITYGSSGTEAITIQHANGNVGIGTATPSEKLEVNGNIKANNFVGNLTGNAASATSSTQWANMLADFSVVQTNTVQAILAQDVNGSVYRYNPTGVKSFLATSLQDVTNIGNVTTNSLNAQSLKLGYGQINSNPTIGVHWGDHNHVGLTFNYYEASVEKEGIRLGYNGNVGIGTSAPISKLDVRGRITVPEIAFAIDGNDNSDPYRLRKVQSSNNVNWLELQINDDADESFRIYGNSCEGYNCGEYSGNLYHSFDASGNVYHKGNVGIGTTAPNRKLTISDNQAVMAFNATGYRNTTIGSDVYGNFVVYDDTDAAYRMVINANGNVGIGTTTPSEKLHVEGGNGLLVKAGDLGTGTSIANFVRYDGNSALYVRGDGNVGIGTTTIDNVQGWNKVLQLHGAGHAKLLVTQSDGVKVGMFAHSGNLAKIGTESQHDLTFTAGYWNDVMTLRTDGNVGIGTTSPTSKLSVDGDVSITGDLKMNGPDSFIWTNGSGTGYTGFWDTANRRVLLYVAEATGGVGIGTTSPSYKLHVAGSTGLIGSLYVDGGIRVTGGTGTAYNSSDLEVIRSGGRPVIGLHWAGTVASTITVEATGKVAIMNNPGTSYENLIANDLFAHNNVYANGGWFRSYGATGLYNETYTNHFYSTSDEGWVMRSGRANYMQLAFRTNDDVTRGYFYADWANNVGILNNLGNWAVKVDTGRNVVMGENTAKVYIGTSTGSEKLNVAGWIATQGDAGWYSATYGGGMYMTDSTWVRIYNNKAFVVDNEIQGHVIRATGVEGFLANNYGIGLTGLYSDTRYQNVFSMGSAYKPVSDGTSLANMYGIAWTHSNIGGQSKAGLGHQMLITEAGVTQTAIGNGIWTRANIYAQGNISAAGGFYDTSDARLKTLVDYTFDARSIKARTYYKNNRLQTGYLAQDVQPLMPHTVNDGGEFLTLNYNQVLVAKISNLEEDLEITRKENKVMKKQIEKLINNLNTKN